MSQKDIDRVFQCLSADIKMICEITELWDSTKSDRYLEDIKAFMDYGYLSAIHLILKDGFGTQVRGRTYELVDLLNNENSARPGNNNWDRYNGTQFSIVISYSAEWLALSDFAKKEFKSDRKIGWSPSKENVGFPNLTKKKDRSYSSNLSGLNRYEFE